MHRLIVFLLLILSAPAAGQNASGTTNPFSNDGTERPRAPDRESVRYLKISGKVCNRLVNHQPAADVEYQEGVDVRGNAVAPADLPGSRFQFKLPENVSFDLALNPLQFAGNANLATLFSESSMNFGRINYNLASRRLTLDGKILGDEEAQLIAEACRNLKKN